MKYIEFKVEDVLKVEQTKSVVSKLKLTEGNIPYVTRTTSNNGYAGTCGNKDKMNDGHCITIGAETAVAFYQPADFVAGNKIYRLSREGLSKNAYLYLAAVLNQRTKWYSYSNARTPEKIKQESICLPVIESEDAKHAYTPDDINWQYMQDRIAELEQDRIAELDAYLKATGLNDYELTEDDKHILASKLKNEDGKEPSKESESLPEGRWWKEWREFIFSDLFTSQTGDTDIQKKDINDKGCYVVSAGLSNHGIIGKTDREAKVIDKNTITVDMFGNAFYRDTDYKMVTHARVFALSPKFKMTESSGLYMTSCMSYLTKKFAYSNMCSWNKIQDLPLCLPIQTDDSGKPVIDASKTYSPKGYIPDWEYMEKYIKATEKEIIKEVVLYKDKVIAKAKEIAGEKEVV